MGIICTHSPNRDRRIPSLKNTNFRATNYPLPVKMSWNRCEITHKQCDIVRDADPSLKKSGGNNERFIGRVAKRRNQGSRDTQITFPLFSVSPVGTKYSRVRLGSSFLRRGGEGLVSIIPIVFGMRSNPGFIGSPQ